MARGRYFNGSFPPDQVTFAGAVMLKVATSVDDRDALVDGFTEIGQQMSEYFPEPDMAPAEVTHLVDLVIRDHNEQVTSASPQTLALFDAFDAMAISGIVYSFAEGGDTTEALLEIGDSAQLLAQQGVEVRGYCYAHAQDTDELIMAGYLALGFGVFADTSTGAETIGDEVVTTLRSFGLEVVWDGSPERRIVVGPMVYELPYHGAPLDEDFSI